MRILYVVDATSPIARNWIERIVGLGWEIHIVSTVPDPAPIEGAVALESLPIGLNRMRVKSLRPNAASGRSRLKSIVSKVVRAVQQRVPRERLIRIAAETAQRDIQKVSPALRSKIEALRPDIVHAMRFPYEGCLAGASVPEGARLLVSVWGNDFTLHAHHSAIAKEMTMRSMMRCDALHADCARDIRLAHEYGYPSERPTLLIPGSGGVQREMFQPSALTQAERAELGIPEGKRVIIHPRGWRAYVRNDLFFPAFAQVAKERAEVLLICPGMAGVQKVEQMVQQLKIESQVKLLPVQPRRVIAKLFRSAEIMVSPTEHDGTPNTLLEGMACGCLPVAGNIESVREWIEDGVNGLLHQPDSSDAMADALRRALDDAELRERACEMNQRLIDDRASYEQSMRRVVEFYEQLSKTG
jgi:glycosyltransferase involved in cell wall biosynthesis